MTALLISFVLWLLSQGSPGQIAQRNQLKAEAEQAFTRHDYALAAALYRQLNESALIPEQAVLFNLAHSYFALGDTERALQQYARLVRTPDRAMAAASLSQLGILTCQGGDSTQALAYFRQALEAQPNYEPARYNYELLRKVLPDLDKPQSQPKAKKSTPKAAPPSTPQNRASQPLASERRQDVLNKLKKIDLSEAKARMLLDAMRASEIQYIQQRTHKAEGQEMKETW